MPEEAEDKLDVFEAFKVGIMISASLTFGLATLYFLAYIDLLGLSILRQIPFALVALAMLFVFNISFAMTMVDQLRS